MLGPNADTRVLHPELVDRQQFVETGCRGSIEQLHGGLAVRHTATLRHSSSRFDEMPPTPAG
jgi:hypothetical protein